MKKCPQCEKPLQHVTVEAIDIYSNGRKAWKGASFACPYCHSIISVGIDPIALKNNIVDEVVKAVRGR